MQRWHLTLLLAILAAVAALVLPETTRTVGPLVPPALPPSFLLTQAATAGDLTVSAGLDQGLVPAGQPSERYLVLTLDGEAASEADARPYNLAVVLDRSGSMASAGKLDYARQAADGVIDRLDDLDRFALVAFSNHAQVVSASAPVTSKSLVRSRIADLTAKGGTNLGAGLIAGLGEVSPHVSAESLDRVIVLSDGRVNQGETATEVLASWASAAGADGVTVSTIGLGRDYNEDLLAQMADWGGGSYHFVDRSAALADILTTELERMAATVAEGVALEIRPGAGVEILDVVGYAHSRLAAGAVTVPVGEIIEGEPRKVVVKVRVPAMAQGVELPVATVSVTRRAGPAPADLAVQALASADAVLVQASIDEDLAVLGTQAEASALADRAVREWEQGNVGAMQDLFDASRLVAGEAASRYGSEALEDQAASVERHRRNLEAAAPQSPEGRYQAILQKESNRALAH